LSETDPFSDAAFLGRLQKLLPMLGSQQPGEADAARRKLLEHLSHYRLSLLDVAARLRDPGTAVSTLSQGARETSLERQLSIARQAKEEAAREASAAVMRVRSLEVELQQATFEIARVLNTGVRFRLWALAGWAATAIVLIFVLGPTLLHLKPASSRAGVTQVAPVSGHPREQDESAAILRVQPGERPGTAAVQDLAIRLVPNDQATIRAFLNRGEPVAILRAEHIGAQTWLLVRTATGTGWTRSGDVMQP
jgi:hypothetical protein